MEVGDQIRQRRIERGLLQDDLAAAVYVSRQTVSSWENGKTYPDVQSLVLLSGLFGVSIDELIQGDVAVMRRTVQEDSQKMRWLSVAMVVALVLAVAFFLGLAAAWRDPVGIGNLTKGDVAGVAVFLPLYAVAMAAAVWAERIKRRHNLVGYREIMAFAEGQPVEDGERQGHGFTRRHPVSSVIVKFTFAAAIGAMIGFMAYKLLG